ncbi:uncharacterized protein PHA67_003188 [Liasis olivaceus]
MDPVPLPPGAALADPYCRPGRLSSRGRGGGAQEPRAVVFSPAARRGEGFSLRDPARVPSAAAELRPKGARGGGTLGEGQRDGGRGGSSSGAPVLAALGAAGRGRRGGRGGGGPEGLRGASQLQAGAAVREEAEAALRAGRREGGWGGRTRRRGGRRRRRLKTGPAASCARARREGAPASGSGGGGGEGEAAAAAGGGPEGARRGGFARPGIPAGPPAAGLRRAHLPCGGWSGGGGGGDGEATFAEPPAGLGGHSAQWRRRGGTSAHAPPAAAAAAAAAAAPRRASRGSVRLLPASARLAQPGPSPRAPPPGGRGPPQGPAEGLRLRGARELRARARLGAAEGRGAAGPLLTGALRPSAGSGDKCGQKVELRRPSAAPAAGSGGRQAGAALPGSRCALFSRTGAAF